MATTIFPSIPNPLPVAIKDSAGNAINNGQQLMANSVPVVLASDQPPINVTVTGFPTTLDTNYGTVGASTLRTASQIGNATGAASFGAGTTGAQVLRVVLPTDQTSIPVTQSGSWTVTANAGTNLNTSLLALDTSVNGILVAQGSTTLGQTGPLIQGAVTTAAPSYTTAKTSPISLTTAGAIRTDSSATTQPISGTVTVVQATAANLNATIAPLTNSSIVKAQVQDNAGNGITSTGNALDINLKTSSITLPVSLAANQSVNVAQINGITPLMGNGVTGTGSQRVTIASDNTAFSVNSIQSGTWTVQQGTPPWSVTGNIASGVSDSGNPVKIGGVFNTTQPTVTNGQRVDIQSTARGAQIVATGADTFNVTVNAALPAGGNTIGAVTQGTSPWVNNISQFGGSNVVTGTGTSGAGIPRVTISNDSNILATQSGTWTVQPGNTANTTPWLVTDSSDGPVTAGTVAAKSSLVGVQFNTSLPTLTTGQQAAAQADSSARLIIAPLTNSSIVKAQLQDNAGTAITVGQKTMSSSVPVVLASDQTNISVDVKGNDTIVSATPTISTSAYSATFQLGGLQTLTSAVRTSGGAAVLHSITILDKASQNADINIYFFNQSPTIASSDRTALDISDSEMASKCIGVIKVNGSNYTNLLNNSAVTNTNVGLLLQASGSTSLFAIAQIAVSATYASTTDLVFRYHFLEN